MNHRRRIAPAHRRGRALPGLLLPLLMLLQAAPVPAQETDNPVGALRSGRWVPMDTHRLYLNCVGEGQPTVVLDSGIGGSSLEWLEVQNRLSDRLRTCAYDRAGYGWSDPGPAPRHTEQVAGELQLMLERAGEKPPYLLVGHSFGGFTARYFAARNPAQVAGLVLVDASHTEQSDLRQPAAATGPITVNPVKDLDLSGGDALPHSVVERMSYLNTRRKAIFAQMDELRHFQNSAAQVLEAGALPEVPLVVLSRGRRAWPPGPEGDREEALWEDKQQALVGLSPLGVHRRAEESAHNIPIEQPSAVVAAILEAAAMRQTGAPP